MLRNQFTFKLVRVDFVHIVNCVICSHCLLNRGNCSCKLLWCILFTVGYVHDV